MPASERFEVGADTGQVSAVAYTSNQEGDAVVEISGGNIYARAQLSNLSNPRNSLEIGELHEEPTAAPTQEVAMSTGPTIAIDANAINIRAQPWGQILGTTSENSEYIVTRQAGDWVQIDWNGQEAWIHGNLGTKQGDHGEVPSIPLDTTPPTAVPTATPEQAPSFEFNGTGPELLPENNYPAFYIYVTEGNNPTYGLSCVMYHDGQEVGRDLSIAYTDTANTGTPWLDDDRDYNCAVKFFEHNPENWAGAWTAELQDGAGEVKGRVGPFTLNQKNQQAYITFTK